MFKATHTQVGPSDPEQIVLLASTGRWWKQTSNLLYAWEAIARCLNGDPQVPRPEWSLPLFG